VDSWEEKPDRNLVVIHATIHVERKSQKAIIIGAGGSLIKRIGKAARQDLEGLLGLRIFLDLHVGVEHNWTKDEAQLRRFGLKE
jgi:GTP-binding protein Era